MFGEIVSRGKKVNQIKVRLETGEVVQAVIPRPILRQLGPVFGTLKGWTVRIAFREPPKNHRVIELAKSA